MSDCYGYSTNRTALRARATRFLFREARAAQSMTLVKIFGGDVQDDLLTLLKPLVIIQLVTARDRDSIKITEACDGIVRWGNPPILDVEAYNNRITSLSKPIGLLDLPVEIIQNIAGTLVWRDRMSFVLTSKKILFIVGITPAPSFEDHNAFQLLHLLEIRKYMDWWLCYSCGRLVPEHCLATSFYLEERYLSYLSRDVNQNAIRNWWGECQWCARPRSNMYLPLYWMGRGLAPEKKELYGRKKLCSKIKSSIESNMAIGTMGVWLFKLVLRNKIHDMKKRRFLSHHTLEEMCAFIVSVS